MRYSARLSLCQHRVRTNVLSALCDVSRDNHTTVKHSPSDLARHWPGWGADATLPVGGSTARVAPLSPPLDCASPSFSLSLSLSLFFMYSSPSPFPYPFSPLDLATKYVRHAFSVESLYPFLSLHPIRRPSHSVSHFRNPYLSHSIAVSSVSLPRPAVSFFSLSRCPSLLLLIALCISYTSTSLFFSHTTYTYALSFSLSLPLFCLSIAFVSLTLTGREIRSNTRGDVPSTPCACAVCRSMSEGSVRRFHGEAPFSTERCGAPPLSRSHARQHTRFLSFCLAISVST